MLLEAEGDLEAGLAGSDDEYLPHTGGVSYDYWTTTTAAVGPPARAPYSGVSSSA
ncbi:hypothetical protein GCM10010389_12320 [Streptomyces echinoruber]|uniref:Uncharacterized protein n=1 Tax=Streptomyces echinoruber TaxID=68898 RepID=A0A918V8U9_9ACTN|nr:hypothetical protein GCM10010389_12320 [Streptomyces echinoruber]